MAVILNFEEQKRLLLIARRVRALGEHLEAVTAQWAAGEISAEVASRSQEAALFELRAKAPRWKWKGDCRMSNRSQRLRAIEREQNTLNTEISWLLREDVEISLAWRSRSVASCTGEAPPCPLKS
jgi:hypothetical protein